MASSHRAMKKLTWLYLGVATVHALCASAALFQIGAHHFTLPDGFTIELVAGTNLVPRPIEADFDGSGRLYVSDSSGSNDKVQKQLEDKPHRIVRLEDSDGDGRFDRSITFADKLMLPQGVMWFHGSLYVSAPPSIWKLTDTNNDGVADVRVEWFKGETLTGCANDLHGPYAGPDGYIYWCKGAFAKQTYTLPNGKKFTTRASHIFRARPDGSGIEPVMTGGMDNPVGLTFAPEGQRIFSCTFLQNPANGQRDGLIHAIYGGVYGKIHDVIDEHPRTGEVMPVMTHLGPAAPAGLMRYESSAFGKEYQNNLFTACFNLHKVTRHIMKPMGATYKTRDSDFLVSDNTDFHPTDVLEDADGSLVVVDTGGWYKLCCPTSQLQKPDVLGGIYRIRKSGQRKVNYAESRGLSLRWDTMTANQLTPLLADERPAVAHRAVAELARRGDDAVSTIQSYIKGDGLDAGRRNAIWALTQIEGEKARIAVRETLLIPDASQMITAVHSISLKRDRTAVPQLIHLLQNPQSRDDSRNAHIRGAAAEALGRIGDKSAVPALLEATSIEPYVHPQDRVFEHAIIYALIEIGDPAQTTEGLKSERVFTQRAALMALDQMPGGNLKAEQVTPLLMSSNVTLKETAAWIVGRHPEWGDSLSAFFGERLKATSLSESEGTELQQQLERFAGSAAIHKLMLSALSSNDKSVQVIGLRTLGRTGVKEMPSEWVNPLTACLKQNDRTVLAAAVSAVRALPAPKQNSAALNAALIALAERVDVSPAIRVAAAASVSGGIRNLSEPLYSRLVATLVSDGGVSERTDSANALARARLSDARLLELASHVKRVGPMELPRVLPVFAQSTNEMVGSRLVESLKNSKSLQSLRAENVKAALTNYPAQVQQRADTLLALLNPDATQQKAHIDQLLSTTKEGDVRRGQGLFNSAKAACSACHAIGYLGGKIGPDLTRIGQVRNERDLLEAIVYPSASFVRSYEPVIVTTKSGDEYSGVMKKDAADEIILVTGPTTEQRIARADIADMRPGTVSVMPSGLADQFSKQEVADLLAFLKATRW
jgi:putative membrane-bound dehydrogenase-like protein